MKPEPWSASAAASAILAMIVNRRQALDSSVEFTATAIDFREPPWPRLPVARLLPVPWFLPIDRFDQAVFAEAFRQALVAGFATPRAIELAAEVNPCPCFRRALGHMHAGVREGRRLGESLTRSRAWVSRALPDALEVGEEFGCLTEAMSAFVRQVRTFTGRRFRKAIGRRPEAARFAAALATLLRDHRLNPKVIRAAVLLSGGGRRFVASTHGVARALEDGDPFVTALERYPRNFDRLFCAFLERAESRDEVRECLRRLAYAGDPAD